MSDATCSACHKASREPLVAIVSREGKVTPLELVSFLVVQLEHLAQGGEVEVTVVGTGHLADLLQRGVEHLRDDAAREVVDLRLLLVGQVREMPQSALEFGL